MQERAVLAGLAHDGADGDALHGRHVAVGDRLDEQRQAGGAAGFAQRPPGVVGRGVVPGAEALRRGAARRAGRDVRVLERHEVWAQRGGVGLREAGEGEGAWDVDAGGGRGGGGRLVGMEGAAVVAGWAEAVARDGLVETRDGRWESRERRTGWEETWTEMGRYREGGRGVVRARERAIGSKEAI